MDLKELAQGHRVGKWFAQGLNPVLALNCYKMMGLPSSLEICRKGRSLLQTNLSPGRVLVRARLFMPSHPLCPGQMSRRALAQARHQLCRGGGTHLEGACRRRPW